jgi:hypothetical protein
MEGFGRILALSADHPQAVDYIVLIGDSQVSQKRLNTLSMLPGPKKCKKMVTNGCKRKAAPAINPARATATLRNRFLLDHFFLDDDLYVRGHILVQLYRNIELAHCLQGFVQLNLPAVNMEAFLLERLRDVAGGDRSE